MLREIQMITSKVWKNRNLPVPRNRAMPSEKRPKASASIFGAARPFVRG